MQNLITRFPVLGLLYGLAIVVLPFLLLVLLSVQLDAARPAAELGTATHSTCHVNGCR